MEYLLTFYGGYSAYYKLHGKPLVFVWAAWSHELEEWGTIFENLKEKGIRAIYIATTLDTKYLSSFDGLQNYGGDELDRITQVYGKVGPIVKTYHILYGGVEKIWVPSVWPGYDERLLPDRMGLFFDREEGQYYLGFYSAARASYPDWIWITSFNEWWENTHIEPSHKYGYKYLFLTEYIVANFKNKPIKPDKLLGIVIDLESPLRTITKLAVSTITVTQQLETTRFIHSVETRTVEVFRTVTTVSTLLTEKRTVEIADIILVTAPLLLVATLSTVYAIRTRRKHASLHRRETRIK